MKLGTSVHTSNEQDSGIRYHKVCWVNNVTNVLCKPDPGTTPNNDYVRFTSSIFMRVFLKQTMSMRPYAIKTANFDTVELLYNGHLGDRIKWPL